MKTTFPRLGRTQKDVITVIEHEGGATNMWTICRSNGDTRGKLIPPAVYRLVQRNVLVELRAGDDISHLSARQQKAVRKAAEKHPRAHHFFVLAEPLVQYCVTD